MIARAEAQLGLLRRDDLLRLGHGTRVIERRVARGLLHEVHPGVFTLGHRGLGGHARLLAALWWCGGDAAISHLFAAAFAGWVQPPREVHLTATKTLRPPPGIVLHTTTRLPLHHTRVRQGRLRMTDWARTVVDCADLLAYRELRLLADELPELPLAQLASVRAALPGRHGSGRTKRLLESELVRTASELERRFARYCTRHGVPHPSGRNVVVAGHKVDCVYLAERLVVELDGRAHHQRRPQMAEDRRRDADYQLAGFRILRLVWEDTALDEPRTAETVRRFLALGARDAANPRGFQLP